jgi:arylsulfatase A-like enzyme
LFSQGLTTKPYPWEEALRVPFLLRYPRQLGSRGRELDVHFNSPDIMPTLLRLAGIPIPLPLAIQGTDYSGLLLGHTVTNLPASAFINMPVSFGPARHYGFAPFRGVRTNSHTYVRSIHGAWLLYDNRRDPYQMHNLCNQPGVRDTQTELERQLQGWLTRLEDEFLPGEVYLKRAGLTHYAEVNLPIGHTVSPWGDWQSTLS